MAEERRGLDSDYREERWAARIKYIHEHAGEWFAMVFFGGAALVLVGAMIWSAFALWGMGHGWVMMLMIGVPVVWIGWYKLAGWSRKTLRDAERRREAERLERRRLRGEEEGFIYDDF